MPVLACAAQCIRQRSAVELFGLQMCVPFPNALLMKENKQVIEISWDLVSTYVDLRFFPIRKITFHMEFSIIIRL